MTEQLSKENFDSILFEILSDTNGKTLFEDIPEIRSFLTDCFADEVHSLWSERYPETKF